jgi:hypothetical protein
VDLEEGTEGAAKRSVDHLKNKGETPATVINGKDDSKKGVAETEVDEEVALESEIKDALYEEKKVDKKQKKKLQKERAKQKEKLALKMEYTNDIVDHNMQGDNEMFSLNKIKTREQLLRLQSTLPNVDIMDDEVDEDNVPLARRGKRRTLVFKDGDNTDEQYDVPYQEKRDSDSEGGHGDSDSELDLRDDDEDKDGKMVKNEDFYESDEDNPLIARLTDETLSERKANKVNMWFNKVFMF